MRIAFISDHVEVGYLWAKGLRGRGLDVHVFLLRHQDRTPGRPFWDDPEVTARPDWYHVVRLAAWPPSDRRPWSRLYAIAVYHLDLLRLLWALRRFDVVNSICNGLPGIAGPVGRFLTDALFNVLHWRPVVVTQTGSDLREEASKTTLYGWFVRRTFERADLVLVLTRDMLARAVALNRRSVYVPFLFLPHQLRHRRLERDRVESLKTASAARLVYFHSVILDWTYRGDERNAAGLKCNDVFLRGFAEYVKTYSDSILIIARRGPDVEQTERLIEALGAAEFVHWIDEPEDRWALGGYIDASDVMPDAFGVGSLGVTAVQALMSGKVVMARLDPRYYGESPIDPLPTPPVVNVATPQDVLREMVRLRDDTVRADLGRKGAAWTRSVHDPKAILDRLESSFRAFDPARRG